MGSMTCPSEDTSALGYRPGLESDDSQVISGGMISLVYGMSTHDHNTARFSLESPLIPQLDFRRKRADSTLVLELATLYNLLYMFNERYIHGCHHVYPRSNPSSQNDATGGGSEQELGCLKMPFKGHF